MVPERLQPILDEVQPLADRFEAAGKRVYLVGGIVRDLLLGRELHQPDIDLTTDAHPDETLAIIRGAVDAVWDQGARFGTIGAKLGDRTYEITTHRAEAYFRDLGVEIDFRPVHLRRLVEPGVGKPPELGPRKTKNAANDIRHWAEALGAEFDPRGRAFYKSDTSLALRCALVAKDLGRFREFHHPAYRARWAEAKAWAAMNSRLPGAR